MYFSFSATELCSRELALQLQSLCEKALKPEDLTFGWVGPERSITLCPCLEDDADVVIGVYFLFCEKAREVGKAFVSLTQLYDAYPGVQPVSQSAEAMITVKDECGVGWGEGRDSLSDDIYEIEGVCACFLKKENLFPFLFTYAISLVGQATISLLEGDSREEFLMECEVPSVVHSVIYDLSIGYIENKSNRGWFENLMILDETQRVVAKEEINAMSH